MSGVPTRFRDAIRRYIPVWLSDRPTFKNSFKFIWVMVAVLDVGLEVLLQGIQAAWPGQGTPTALPMIGRSRGILRGEADTDATFGASLRLWLDKWRRCGSMAALAARIHEYLGNAPRVRIVNRAGFWVTCAADGTLSTTTAAWNWDGTSHPERATWWSEIWIIVYPTQWAAGGTYGDGGAYGGSNGLGHNNTEIAYEAIKQLIATWKSAHTMVRAVIWTSDAALFDPATPASLPNGTWGNWGTTGDGSRVAGGRNTTTCHYWEP